MHRKRNIRRKKVRLREAFGENIKISMTFIL